MPSLRKLRNISLFPARIDKDVFIKYTFLCCGCGGIGRRVGLRSQYGSVQVQVLSSAPKDGD